MTSFKNYIKYLKDNPEGYWFKRKLYGWGWVPVTWQGWLIVFGYVGLVILFALTIDIISLDSDIIFTFILPVALLTAVLISIAYKKGEKPSWRWGQR
ncbi:MAG: hypothetical protein AAB629_01810 [Patescibacteria group bacterium]